MMIAVITCTYHLLGTRRFSAVYSKWVPPQYGQIITVSSFFYWDWFSGSFSWSSSSIPPYKFTQHDCHAECPLSTRTPFPLCCFALNAERSLATKGKAQRSLFTLPRAHTASNVCFALNAGHTQKARVLYDVHKNTTCTTGHLRGDTIRYLSIFVRNESIEIEWDRRIDSQ